MPERRIVAGQIVNDVKVRRARQLRKEMTPAEAALWEAVRDRRLDGIKFRRQQVIDGFIVDFYCHAAGLFIEVDGGVHDTRHDADAEREKMIRRRQLRVLRLHQRGDPHGSPGRRRPHPRRLQTTIALHPFRHSSSLLRSPSPLRRGG